MNPRVQRYPRASCQRLQRAAAPRALTHLRAFPARRGRLPTGSSLPRAAGLRRVPHEPPTRRAASSPAPVSFGSGCLDNLIRLRQTPDALHPPRANRRASRLLVIPGQSSSSPRRHRGSRNARVDCLLHAGFTHLVFLQHIDVESNQQPLLRLISRGTHCTNYFLDIIFKNNKTTFLKNVLYFWF